MHNAWKTIITTTFDGWRGSRTHACSRRRGRAATTSTQELVVELALAVIRQLSLAVLFLCLLLLLFPFAVRLLRLLFLLAVLFLRLLLLLLSLAVCFLRLPAGVQLPVVRRRQSARWQLLVLCLTRPASAIRCSCAFVAFTHSLPNISIVCDKLRRQERLAIGRLTQEESRRIGDRLSRKSASEETLVQFSRIAHLKIRIRIHGLEFLVP